MPTATSPTLPLSTRLWSRLSTHGPWLLVLAALLLAQFLVLTSGGWGGRRGNGSPSRIAWRTDYAAALAEAADAGKPVLLDFTAEWCPPCQDMDAETWPDDRVEDAVAAGFVPVLVDIDVPANGEVAARYGVDAIPTLVIADAAGTPQKQHRGFIDADGLLGFLAR